MSKHIVNFPFSRLRILATCSSLKTYISKYVIKEECFDHCLRLNNFVWSVFKAIWKKLIYFHFWNILIIFSSFIYLQCIGKMSDRGAEWVCGRISWWPAFYLWFMKKIILMRYSLTILSLNFIVFLTKLLNCRKRM